MYIFNKSLDKIRSADEFWYCTRDLIKYAQNCKIYPAGNYMFKVNNRNTRTRCEICSKLICESFNEVYKMYIFNKSLDKIRSADEFWYCTRDLIKYAQNCKIYPAGNYMFKVNNRNTRTRCEICSKLTIKTPERR